MNFLDFDAPLALTPVIKELDLDTGLLLQHHRDEGHRLGVVHRRLSKTGPIQTQWYADYMPHRHFHSYEELRAAAGSDSEVIAKTMADQFTACLQGWPLVQSTDELPKAKLQPRCQATGNATAAYVMVVATGWHPLMTRTVYLSEKGVKMLRSAGLAETLATIDARH